MNITYFPSFVILNLVNPASWERSFSKVTGYKLDNWNFTLSREKRFFSLPLLCPETPWGQPSLLPNGMEIFSTKSKEQ
jgi:hypothetical protein